VCALLRGLTPDNTRIRFSTTTSVLPDLVSRVLVIISIAGLIACFCAGYRGSVMRTIGTGIGKVEDLEFIEGNGGTMFDVYDVRRSGCWACWADAVPVMLSPY
jgi:hypothetical protein